MNVVDTVPSSDVLTSSGSFETTLYGRILDVGKPVWTVLICTVTGIVSSLSLKNTSTDVKKTPDVSSTRKVCARGS